MPELPEVETVRSELAEFLIGRELVKVASPSKKNLRKPLNWPKKTLKINDVTRWGKRLFINFNELEHLDISLGMTGSFRKESNFKARTHDHLVFTLDDSSKLIFTDPRRFGWVEYKSGAQNLKGWDPILSPLEEKTNLIKVMKSSKKDLYSFLMDQTNIVGLGNIYVQEALFRAGAYPFKRCHKTSYADLDLIIEKSQEILKEALKFRGTTIINYKSAKGESGGFQNRLRVYGKVNGDLCLSCKGPLKKVQKARSVTFCRVCQK